MAFALILLVATVAVAGSLTPPAQPDADVLPHPGGGEWMVYTPNHPNGCLPMPVDCYVVWVSTSQD
jgi:hypothetical protein